MLVLKRLRFADLAIEASRFKDDKGLAINRLTILTNIPALMAAGDLASHTAGIGKTLERLSTGQRINRASDDAAGLALSEFLNAERRITSIAIQNTNTAISLVATATSAVDEISNMLIRLHELAQVSINGINNPQTRSPLQSEFVAVSQEISRIARAAKFNGINLTSLTSPSPYPLVFQVGIDGKKYSQVGFSGVQGTLNFLGLGTANESQIYSINDYTSPLGQAAARTALEAVKEAIDRIGVQRGELGAASSRLTFAVSNLEGLRQNLTDAVGSIRDVDIAMETATLLSTQIRRDASAAILAQANQQPKDLIKLLS